MQRWKSSLISLRNKENTISNIDFFYIFLHFFTADLLNTCLLIVTKVRIWTDQQKPEGIQKKKKLHLDETLAGVAAFERWE